MKNASRNLHKLMVRDGRQLPIDVTMVPTPVRLLKGKPRVDTVDFPVLLPSTWLRFMLSIGGELILGGHELHSESDWRGMFRSFWSNFQRSQPGVDLGQISPDMALPLCVHGDEGRGRAKRPIMCISFQPMISHLGPAVTNTSGILGTLETCFLDVLYRSYIV